MKYEESKHLDLKSIEYFIYFAVWLGVFSIPFFQYRKSEIVNWSKITEEWIPMTSFLIVFLLNSTLLVPQFLFKKKYTLYIVITLLSIIALVWLSIGTQYIFGTTTPPTMPPMNLGPGMPPMELGTNMPAPMGYRLPTQVIHKSVFMVFIDNFILSVLIVAAGTSLKMMSKWLSEEDRRKDVEKEQLKTELALLRHQVSPHFLMNTLNNIHALVDINSESAKDAIIKLSTLMRYLLYETAQGKTSLKKEIEFIESYIKLMELRFSTKVVITLDIPELIPDLQIPPMLFISFLENAFKHGVSYKTDSFVFFKLILENNQIRCSIRNSKQINKEPGNPSHSGIGLTNIRKSLALLYKKDYVLNIYESEKEFEVQLTIPIYDNKMYSNR